MRSKGYTLVMNYHLDHIEHPQTLIRKYSDLTSPTCLTFTFSHTQHYLSHAKTINLSAAVLIQGTSTLCMIIESSPFPALKGDLTATSYFEETSKLWSVKAVELNTPWRLESLRIPKPWGAEVWYTGMEDRGICTVKNIPLPWLLAITATMNSDQAKPNIDPILLKILDPYSDAKLGDLYFELHEEKIEVYIVTAIDKSVWPDGIGKIRYGFNQSKIKEFSSTADFKSAYLKSVRQYQVVRNQIDQLRSESKEISKVLDLEEEKLKEQMYAFTQMKNLKVGDIIHVHPFFPHSLQHGVRVIEFQTAHYERYILSFTQKVLTQGHWDTEEALKNVETALPVEKPLRILENSKGVLSESVAEFDQFSTFRLSIKANSSFTLKLENYALIIAIKGICEIVDKTESVNILLPEESFYLPAALEQIELKAMDEDTVLLIAKQN